MYPQKSLSAPKQHSFHKATANWVSHVGDDEEGLVRRSSVLAAGTVMTGRRFGVVQGAGVVSLFHKNDDDDDNVVVVVVVHCKPRREYDDDDVPKVACFTEECHDAGGGVATSHCSRAWTLASSDVTAAADDDDDGIDDGIDSKDDDGDDDDDDDGDDDDNHNRSHACEPACRRGNGDETGRFDPKQAGPQRKRQP